MAHPQKRGPARLCARVRVRVCACTGGVLGLRFTFCVVPGIEFDVVVDRQIPEFPPPRLPILFLSYVHTYISIFITLNRSRYP